MFKFVFVLQLPAQILIVPRTTNYLDCFSASTIASYGNNQQQWPNQDDHLDQQPAARGGAARELQEQPGDARAGRPQFSDSQDQQPVTQVQQAPGLQMEPLVDTEHIEFIAFSEDDMACDPLVNTEHFDLTPSAGAASTIPSDHVIEHATPVPIAAAQAQASAMVSAQAQALAPVLAQLAQAQATAQVPAMAQVPQMRGRSPRRRAMTGSQHPGDLMPPRGSGTQPPGDLMPPRRTPGNVMPPQGTPVAFGHNIEGIYNADLLPLHSLNFEMPPTGGAEANDGNSARDKMPPEWRLMTCVEF